MSSTWPGEAAKYRCLFLLALLVTYERFQISKYIRLARITKLRIMKDRAWLSIIAYVGVCVSRLKPGKCKQNPLVGNSNVIFCNCILCIFFQLYCIKCYRWTRVNIGACTGRRRLATTYYLSRCWCGFMSPYDITMGWMGKEVYQNTKLKW